ncbi:MAG: sigma 54-interacting transcriptional regulator [Planctomycetota bacterium]
MDDLVPVLVQVCRALEYIHSRGLIHHDIKPENVLVTEGEGEDPGVKLIDFGLVGRQRMGAAATVPGTIHYIAPEIFKGLQIDRRSDLYSLGILLYQITTGSLPYNGSTQLEVIRGHFEGGAIPPREHNPEIPEGLEFLILRLMAREAWERYPSANAVITGLNEIFKTKHALETKATQESYILTGRFVGREKEFAFLKHALSAAVGGVSPVSDGYRFKASDTPEPVGAGDRVDDRVNPMILVTGEPGIGKTRLMKEFKTFVQIQGVLFLEGSCSPGHSTPFGPILPVLGELIRTREGQALLPRFGSELVKVLPEIADLVEITPAVPLKPEQERLRLIHALSRFLLEVSDAKPFVLHLSDLQWADDITLELLTYLSRNLQPFSETGSRRAGEGGDALSGLYGRLSPHLLLCATAQPSEETDERFEVTRAALQERGASEVPLKGLGQPEVCSLLRSMLGMDHDPVELAAVIHGKTEGNPFFVEEVMKSLVEEGSLYRERGRWVAKADSLEQIEIPAGVSEVIQQRLDRLTGGEKEVLRAVSVFNGPAPVSVLGRARGRDVGILLADLSALVKKDILMVEEMADGERGYVFTHQSMKEAVYTGMALRTQRALHRHVGKAFEEEYGEDISEVLEEMATHFIRGRDQKRAFDYGVRAGQKARRMHANREALDFYLAAMEFGDAQKVDPSLQEETANLHDVVGELDTAVGKYRAILDREGEGLPAETAARIRLRLSETIRKKGDFDGALKELRRGEEVLQGRLDTAEGAKLLAFTGFLLLMKGAREEAVSPLTRALRIDRRRGETAHEGAVYNFLGHLYYLRGTFDKAKRCYEKSLQLSEKGGNLVGVAGALDSLGNAYMRKGLYDEASSCHRRSLEIRKKTGDIHQIADSLNNLGTLSLEKRDFVEAEEYERECLRIRERIGDDHGMGVCYLNLGIAYDGLERYHAAIDSFQKSLAIREKIGDPLGVANSLNGMGNIYKVLGDFGNAEECLKKSLFIATEQGWIEKRLNSLVNLGATYLSIGDMDRAEEVLREGYTLSLDHEFRIMEGLTLMTLGDAARLKRDWGEAARCLERAREVFQDLGSEGYLCELDTMQSRLRLEMGDVERAQTLARQALETAENLDLQKAVTEALLALGQSEVELLQEEEALRHLNRALKRAETANNLEILWEIHHALGNLNRDTAKFDTAQFHYRKASEGMGAIARGLKPQWKAVYQGDRRRTRLREDMDHLQNRMEDTRYEIGYSQRVNLKKRITDLENHHMRLLKLLEINKRINSEHDLIALLDLIMDVVIEMCDAERGFLILEEEGKVQVKTARNINREEIQSPEFDISHSIVRQTMQSGVPLILTNAQEDERFRQQQSVMNLNLRSVLCLPFKIKDRVLGAIYLDNRLHRGLFSDRDLFTLEAFGDQAAIAIENTRLFQDNRVKAQKIEKLNLRLAERLQRTTAELASAREHLELNKREFGLKYDYSKIVGRDTGMRETLKLIDRIVDSNVPCLIQGSSGTGKELIARAIHFNGPRKEKQFVSENCAAISESLLESELFGYEKGAFTGADKAKKGLFEIAHKGTLFLDEISEMSMGMQAKLLRVLQEGEIRRVGGLETRKIDVNIVSATNRDLKKQVETSLFREDLYYRISTIFVQIPPLRERRQDIPLLVEHFMQKICDERNDPLKEIDKEVINSLLDYDWPGNVRELENEVIRMVTLSDQRIKLEVLSPRIRGDDDPARLQPAMAGKQPLKAAMEEFEKRILRRELEKNHWNKSRTAKELGLSRVALHKKLAKYQIK